MTENKFSRPSANILLEAAELQEKKGQDYNGAQTSIEQNDYYPRGVWSILDVVNAKYLRMVSVLEQMEHGGKANFESVEDSAIDLINYASFVAAYMRGDVPGQTAGKDIFNKTISKQTHPTDVLTPTKFKNTNTVTVSSTTSYSDTYLTSPGAALGVGKFGE
jgi:hypothetical protein